MVNRIKAGVGLITVAAGVTIAAAAVASPPDPPQLHSIQYLYGSAEADAVTRGTWHDLTDYVTKAMKASDRHSLVDYLFNGLQPNDRHGVVLAAGSSLAHPSFVPCGDKPPAVVLDVDETSILNLGAEYDDLVAQRPYFDPDVWIRWEKTGYRDVVPTPGAKEALDTLRAMGVTVVFNTNRNAFDAAQTEAALNGAGLGPAKHGQTLFLQGDTPTGGMKDARRQIIASRYCVLAMAGDQLVDFSDHFDADPDIWNLPLRRAAAERQPIASLWGNGWFAMPNPVYGSALQGGPDDIFPKKDQWRDPGPAAAAKAPVPAPAPAVAAADHAGAAMQQVLIAIDFIAAAIAFGAGCIAVRRKDWVPVYAGASFAVAAISAVAIAAAWRTLDAGERVALPLLMAVALFLCWRAYEAWRLARSASDQPSPTYVETIGLTPIAYLAGILLLVPVPAGFPWWLAAIIAIAAVVAAAVILGRFERKIAVAA